MPRVDADSEIGGGEGPGARFVSARGILVTVVIAILTTGLVAYTLYSFWPPERPGGGDVPRSDSPVTFFGAKISLSTDARLFLVIALAGCLGGMIHVLRSLSWYVGNRDL